MRVNIDMTFEISDEDRTRLADVIDQKVSKRKATRAECKEFILDNGFEDWTVHLTDQHNTLTGEENNSGEDLIGGAEEDLIGDNESLEDLI